MADNPSILATHVEKRGIYGTHLEEVSAIALDCSAMLARVVAILEVLVDSPEVKNSPRGQYVAQLMAPLKARSDAHITAMSKLRG